MEFKHGAIAEGVFDIGILSSLGKAGVDKAGKLKAVACSSITSARRRAIRSIANRLRFRRGNNGNWVDFKNLTTEIQDNLIDEVVNSVIWKTVDGISRVKNLNYEIYDNASRKVVY